MVVGMVGDKDIHGVLSLMPKDATYYFTQAEIPRALAPSELAQKAATLGLQGQCYKNVHEAIAAARSEAREGDMIFIGGSTFIVADALLEAPIKQ